MERSVTVVGAALVRARRVAAMETVRNCMLMVVVIKDVIVKVVMAR